MNNFVKLLVDLGTLKSNKDQENQKIRFANTIAIIHLSFIVLVFFILLYLYGYKVGAKLVLLSSVIPVVSILSNKIGKVVFTKYWLSITIPVVIIVISIITKHYNPSGYTGFYEFFDTRMLLLVSAVVPLLVFPRHPLKTLIIALLPSFGLLFFFDSIHEAFGVGYNHFFEDAKGGYYLAVIFFDISYLLFVLGILSLKKSNEKLVENNDILINDLNNKNQIQEKILLRKQELLVKNKEVSERLILKQEELLKSKSDLELAAILINEQKSELKFKNMKLTNLIDEKTRELKKANEELIVQNNGLLQFSNTVSHNLRAPVASLLGLIRLLEIEEDEKLKKEILSHIKSSSVALDTIIVDLNKVVDTRNQLCHLKENISLSDEIKQIESLLQVAFKESGALLKTNLKKDSIYFIRSYMHSILLNLINNAIKYSNPDQKNIIQINSWENKNSICLEVKDNGLGIDLVKFGDNLFKMHKRFHDHVEGKGLGLYLVKQQVEAMNGEITAKSKPETGTVFHMRFPIPEEVDFQEYYNTAYATIAYNAQLMASILIWHKPCNSKEYKEVLSTNKEMFANYNAVKWLVDVRSLGYVPKEDREWFASITLPEIARRGCKIMVVVKNRGDSKDFTYWQSMLEVMDEMGVLFKIFYDYDLAIEFLQKK